MLEPAGIRALAGALSGSIGLLCGDVELDGLRRWPLTLAPGVDTVLRFGPFRRAQRVTGIAVFRDGARILTEPLPEPALLAAGQTLELAVSLGI